jgi:uncharacterized protein
MAKRKTRWKRSESCQFIGCLHLGALCGSPEWSGQFSPIIDRCLREAEIYLKAGADGLIVENTHDRPYQKARVDAGCVAGVAVACHAVRSRFDGPIGLQVLAGADVPAIDVAATCDLDFVRVEGFAYAHVADEGIIEGDAANILRRRSYVRAEGVEVWTDIKKKHGSHALTSDLDLRDEARGAVYCGADGVIVTGGLTGEPPCVDDVASLRDLGCRVVVGSGVDMKNIADFVAVADVLIVGSACKKGGDWTGSVESGRVRRLVDKLRSV